MRFGRTVPNGFLPVFSVDTEEEARSLIVLACPRDDYGQHYARELVEEQSLENLREFSDKLARAYEFMQAARLIAQGTLPVPSTPAEPAHSPHRASGRAIKAAKEGR